MKPWCFVASSKLDSETRHDSSLWSRREDQTSWARILGRSLSLLAGFLIPLLTVPLAAETIRLEIHPSSLRLNGSDRLHGFLVSAVDELGTFSDVTAQCQIRPGEDGVVAPGEAGRVTGLANGKVTLNVDWKGLHAELPVVVEGMADPPEPSFRQDILPLLTKAGCNAGGCHGKISGQNGFRLSLRGYAPEWDYEWLATEFGGRRINPALPEQSLLLLKAINRVPHEGGQRFTFASREYELLRRWIGHRAPGPRDQEAAPQRLEILPGNRVVRPGQTQSLLVRALYEDGRVRDVTWLAQFFSNDESTLAVSERGVITALRSGEATVRAHFQGLVQVMVVTVPYDEQPDPRPYAEHFNLVDDHVFAKLHSLGIPPSPPCEDATFLRRVFLDTVGVLPSSSEAAQFQSSAQLEKRSEWIDQLLERPEYVDYWTLQFADLFQNRKERDHDVRGAKGVRSFHAWLHHEIAINRPWNELARSILTASGSVAEHPEIGYFITTIGEFREKEKSEVTDSVAQAFLGTRIGCARCHNHPLEKYTQDDFYHFAAFFSRVSFKRNDPQKGETVLEVATQEEMDLQKRQTESKRRCASLQNEIDGGKLAGIAQEEKTKKLAEEETKLAELEKRYRELRAKPPMVRQPRTNQEMAARPLDRVAMEFPSDSDPRDRLAEWVTNPENESFAGAMVNRIWKHFMGIGLVEPVDDLRASNPPSNPELWTALCREFVEHGYDLKYLMRLILNSRAYQLSSDTLAANAQDQKFYSHYYLRRLPAEVLMDAVCQVTGVPDGFPGYPVGLRAVQIPDPSINSYFLTLFGRSDRVTACACERQGEVTLPQLLHLYNSEEINRKIHDRDGQLRMLLQEEDDAVLVDRLYQLALSRSPGSQERSATLEALGVMKVGERQSAFGDLLWALLNTKEFAFNH